MPSPWILLAFITGAAIVLAAEANRWRRIAGKYRDAADGYKQVADTETDQAQRWEANAVGWRKLAEESQTALKLLADEVARLNTEFSRIEAEAEAMGATKQ